MFHNWLNPSDLVQWLAATLRNHESLLGHYNWFIKIVVIKNFMTTRTFRSFNIASCSLHEGKHLSTFWNYKQEQCCATPIVYIQLTVTCTSRTHPKWIDALHCKMVTRTLQNITLYVWPILLNFIAPCGSGLQDQQTEPVQIHCKQLHSHTSYFCRLATVCNIMHLQLKFRYELCFDIPKGLSLNPNAHTFSAVWT